MQLANGLVLSNSLFRLISDRRHESECLSKLYEALYALSLGDRTLKLASKLPGNYFTFREKSGMISYIPNNREQIINRDGTWSRKGRQSMKPARWIRMMLNPRIAARFKDDAFAQFNAILLHEELRTQLTFSEASIREAYYDRNKFVRMESCMWGMDVAPFYESFGCRALVATVPKHRALYVGRAIIWPDVQVAQQEGRITLMDRVYCATEEVSLAFREYASDHGWWRKLAQGSNQGPFLKPNGEDVQIRLIAFANRNLDEISFYPYLDTLLYGGDNWVSNSDTGDASCKGFKWIYRNGGPESKGTRTNAYHEGQVTDYLGQWINEDEAVSIGGQWFHEDSDMIVRDARTNDYILRSDAYYIDLPYNGDDGFYICSRFVRREV